MTEKYEIRILVSDEKYVDQIIVGLVRQGYNVYFNSEEGIICFTGSEEEVVKL